MYREEYLFPCLGKGGSVLSKTSLRSPKNSWLAAALYIAALLTAPAIVVWAQTPAPAADVHARGDIAGDWQGTLALRNGKTLRIIVRITKAEKGFTAKWYSIDQGGQPISVSAVAVDGSKVKLTIDMLDGTYDGALAADGTSMVGTWTQGPNPLPLTFVRATKETAWEIPAAPPPMKRMPDEADPTFDVAAIKPNDSGAPNMLMLRFGANDFETRNSSLIDLIAFAYGVQARQITGGPEWMGHDRYDIKARPDFEGVPNPAQQRSLVRKLLADRFKLTFHKDKKEMSAYVLTVVKTGSKLNRTEFNGPGMSFGLVPKPTGTSIPVRNATMSEFSGVLQSMVLDRPVVNDTGLTDHYDFALTFMPDDSQFNGHPPVLNGQAPKPDAADAAPSLFEAIQQQLGLKLEAQKTAVDVIAIDHVEKPSAN
jgi:uncharacterized protein (TIGR03435 family)